MEDGRESAKKHLVDVEEVTEILMNGFTNQMMMSKSQQVLNVRRLLVTIPKPPSIAQKVASQALIPTLNRSKS